MKTCKYGHEMTPDNISSKGGCLACHRLANKRYRKGGGRLPAISREERNRRMRDAYQKKKAVKVKTHCKYGHELTSDNLTNRGRCKQCRTNMQKAYSSKPEVLARRRAKAKQKRKEAREASLTDEQKQEMIIAAQKKAEEDQRKKDHQEFMQKQAQKEQIARQIKKQQLKTRSGKVIPSLNKLEESLFPERPPQKEYKIKPPDELNVGAAKEKLREFNDKMLAKGYLKPTDFTNSDEHATNIELGEL